MGQRTSARTATWASTLPRTPDRGVPAAGRVDHVAELAYAAYRGELLVFALRATRDPASAEDIVQEAFLRLIDYGHPDPPQRVRAWLYRVAANLIATRGRRLRSAGRSLPLMVVDEVDAAGPEPTTLARERHVDLTAALARLAGDAQTGLVLTARGYAAREVGASIGRTPGATRTYLCRARSRLRASLESPDPDAATIGRDDLPRLGSRRARRRDPRRSAPS